MRLRKNERVEHHTPSETVVENLRLAGGNNPFGESMFRVVWGYNRIVPIHGEWQEFEQYVARITAVPVDVPMGMGEPEVLIPKALGVRGGESQERFFTKLKRSVVETRLVPKYLPGNCWHLEMWCGPTLTREQWKEAGKEKFGIMTVDTAGPYPDRGEYELCNPLTHDGTSHGQPIPLEPSVVYDLVRMLKVGRERFSLAQRRAAIEQEAVRREEGFVRVTQDRLRDGLRPFLGEEFITKP
jgi:hypothetical protein